EPGAGLVIVAGGPGQGKTTTLAALVEDLTARRPCRVVTIEEPVEYLLKDRRGVVVQREVGTDVPSAAAALRSVSRQDLDVLVVGDLTDPAAARLAIEAVETGRLVLAGLLAGDIPQILERLAATPEDDTALTRARIAASLRGIIVQRLVPAAGGKRRGPAGTLLRVGPETRAQLVDGVAAPELPGSVAFEPPAEPPRKRRTGDPRAAVEDDAPGD
ncbi:MAG TPA: ATPase, T2SS/T4P/T4SS family, partial [Polyangia bacterium]|nr:ATPase, T2SS/T4P/T4SS family [Polyangia bacterium]